MKRMKTEKFQYLLDKTRKELRLFVSADLKSKRPNRLQPQKVEDRSAALSARLECSQNRQEGLGVNLTPLDFRGLFCIFPPPPRRGKCQLGPSFILLSLTSKKHIRLKNAIFSALKITPTKSTFLLSTFIRLVTLYWVLTYRLLYQHT